jgi:hypothetical protein
VAVFSVEGKLGTGKTLFTIWRAQDAIRSGRVVASNVDIDPVKLNPRNPGHIIRIPDKPTSDDLDAMGHGNPDSYDEDKNGVLILDELGTWLNSRSFQDKSRARLLDWLIHARKHGWDVYLIVQDAGMIDKQVREALIEYQVKCMRMDKVRIPFIGHFTGLIRARWAYLPKFHLATARVGTGPGAVVAERWQYLGKHLYPAYDTRQVFRSDYAHGSHSVLPAWDHIKPLTTGEVFTRWWRSFFPSPLPARVYPPRTVKPELLTWIKRLPPDRRIPFMRKHNIN